MLLPLRILLQAPVGHTCAFSSGNTSRGRFLTGRRGGRRFQSVYRNPAIFRAAGSNGIHTGIGPGAGYQGNNFIGPTGGTGGRTC